MKIQYFPDTDTLYVELRPSEVVETRDLDQNTVLDLDEDGQVVAVTFEHPGGRADLTTFACELPIAA